MTVPDADVSTRAELLAAMTRLARRHGLSNPQADELLERCNTVAEMEQAVVVLLAHGDDGG